MSNLTANAWASKTLEKLRVMERECVDTDLFCVGYLIPLVELVELEYSSEVESPDQWYQWYSSYLEHCLELDNIDDDDTTRLRIIAQDCH